MARAPRAKLAGPDKFDPAAPAPLPEGTIVRAKASRPSFRRAGLVFNDRDWTAIGPEVEDEVSLAILQEPVLTIQVWTGEDWRTLTAEDRAAAIAEATGEETGKA